MLDAVRQALRDAELAVKLGQHQQPAFRDQAAGVERNLYGHRCMGSTWSGRRWRNALVYKPPRSEKYAEIKVRTWPARDHRSVRDQLPFAIGFARSRSPGIGTILGRR